MKHFFSYVLVSRGHLLFTLDLLIYNELFGKLLRSDIKLHLNMILYLKIIGKGQVYKILMLGDHAEAKLLLQRRMVIGQ